MQLRTYVVTVIVVAVVCWVAQRWRLQPRHAPLVAERIFVCLAWSGVGAPPAVRNLLAKAVRRERLVFGVCARDVGEGHASPFVKFITQRQYAGAALGVEQCLRLAADEPLVLTVGSYHDALYAWDIDLERALATCPPQSVLTYLPNATANTGFPCVRKLDRRGMHVQHAARRTQGDTLRVLCHTEACSFGPRRRFASITTRAPSSATSNTAASWQLHTAGWTFWAPPRASIVSDGAKREARASWRVDSGIASAAAAAYRRWAGLGVAAPSSRAQLGIVNAHDEDECASKHGSRARVHALMGSAHAWPAVQSVDTSK